MREETPVSESISRPKAFQTLQGILNDLLTSHWIILPSLYHISFLNLINLDGCKNGLIEPKRAGNADVTRHEEESQRRETHVAKVEHVCRSGLASLQLLEVHKGIEEDVKGGGASRAERAPPPVVVLPTKLKVAEEDGNLGAGNNEDDEHQQKEAEDVVVLIHPDRTENEIQLNEAGAEGQDAADQERKGDAHEPGLIRNLAGNVGGVDGELDGLLLVSEVGTEEDQRSRNTKPKDEKDEHGGEGDGIAGSLGQGNDVHDEKDEERNAGETQGGEDSGLLPALALEGLVQAGGVVSSDAAQKDV